MLEEVEAPRAVPVPLVPGHHVKMEHPSDQKQSTQSLLREFETVYDGIGALTPPQSPPTELTTLEPLLKQVYSVPAFRPELPATPQPDVEHELAIVDELVRTRAEDMQWQYPSSPGSSDCSSSASEDPEWVPEPVESYVEGGSIAKSGRKRSKPYSRGHPDDKKSRKKEQNKNAATRYRMKKKAEVEVILSEEKVMLDHNAELGAKITDLQREIKYLKGLMRDLFKAKGLID
ncbi:unnamed protein product [Brassicogethes aeneus]|uniref:BZIP domain-containing protein n=1 Tax=Brassicogethes aeneus TaxID=1431903 RepID=A0A9P0AQ47_BRAAE|nr:unnamed protein product [Brassicogethes aeneus]